VTSLAIEELPIAIKEDVEDFLESHPKSPAARLRPRMGLVEDIWLALSGQSCEQAPVDWDRHPVTHWRISTGTSWSRFILETVPNQIRPSLLAI